MQFIRQVSPPESVLLIVTSAGGCNSGFLCMATAYHQLSNQFLAFMSPRHMLTYALLLSRSLFWSTYNRHHVPLPEFVPEIQIIMISGPASLLSVSNYSIYFLYDRGI